MVGMKPGHDDDRVERMQTTQQPEHFDVIIVGAGLSGIGAGYHLQHKCPNKSFVILEGRDCIGGRPCAGCPCGMGRRAIGSPGVGVAATGA